MCIIFSVARCTGLDAYIHMQCACIEVYECIHMYTCVQLLFNHLN